jgi:hypothetical protein
MHWPQLHTILLVDVREFCPYPACDCTYKAKALIQSLNACKQVALILVVIFSAQGIVLQLQASRSSSRR